MPGAQYSPTTLPIILMISFLAANTCNMDQIGYKLSTLNKMICKIISQMTFL
jgi:hypothetical protein